MAACCESCRAEALMIVKTQKRNNQHFLHTHEVNFPLRLNALFAHLLRALFTALALFSPARGINEYCVNCQGKLTKYSGGMEGERAI